MLWSRPTKATVIKNPEMNCLKKFDPAFMSQSNTFDQGLWATDRVISEKERLSEFLIAMIDMTITDIRKKDCRASVHTIVLIPDLLV
jgi:hypothetical protein